MSVTSGTSTDGSSGNRMPPMVSLLVRWTYRAPSRTSISSVDGMRLNEPSAPVHAS